MITFKDTIEVVVFDIEGTICPITFVKDTLFPYFLEQAPSYLSKLKYPLDSKSDDQITKILSEFTNEVTESEEKLSSHIKHLVDTDQKVAPLKSFQGLVWKLGYELGELKAPLYDDALEFFNQPPPLVQSTYIYSSGSIAAQKLLFKYVKNGDESIDLNPKLSGYFDITTAGYKQEQSSYEKILQDIKYEDKPSKVLFLSDNVNEVNAALKAGLNSVIVVKPGNAPLSEEDEQKHSIIKSLNELNF